ncbi:MAG: ABC transporter ATP-binding protein [Bacteroidia bacterium]|nr:ABC transporter ATP-binding protein [Bacteroidia bacterium]
MNNHAAVHRFEEIRLLAKDQDISRLSRRILDFLADFPLSSELQREAISFRAAYNAYAILEQAEQTEESRFPLLHKGQQIVNKIEGFLPSPALSESIPEIPLKGEVELRENSTVFDGKGITKSFYSSRYTFQLPPIDLQLRLGEITGVVGENGNGKTTLLRMVAGDLEASGGTLSYPYFPDKDWYRIKQNIAFITQQLPVWQGYLKENLHFTAAIHGLKGKENEDRVEFIIHRLGLSRYEDALWSEISSGYKLRFELARALVWNPGLLIIDEPLANLDINTQQVFLQDLRYLADSTQYPVSILLSSQHLHEVESIADNIIFIKNGETLYNGKMKDFGQDRTQNLFELNTPMSKTELVIRLSSLEGIEIEDIGQHIIFHTTLNIDANTLLSELIKANVPVDYFRNISTSTLKLFRERHNS